MNVCLIGGGRKRPMVEAALDAVYSPETPTNVLLVPSACSTPTSYAKKVGSHLELFRSIGVNVDVLHDFEQSPVDPAQKFGQATLIFTIAGNSPHLMRTLAAHGTHNYILEAADQGKMLAGTSAGALAPFALAHTNPSRLNEDLDFTLLPMLDLIPAAGAVHADIVDKGKPTTRLDDFASRLPATGMEYGLAFDNNAGLLAVPDTVRIVRSDEMSEVHLLRADGPEVTVRPIEDDSDMHFTFSAIMRQR